MDSFPKDCSLCDKSLVSKKDWFSHLLQLKHADKMKEECHSWGAEIRRSSLVICGEAPLARNAVLKYFSQWGRFIVDFVCDESHPLFGVIRFDNLKTIEKVLEKTGSEVVIEGNKIELKNGSGLSVGKWKEALPEIAVAMSDSNAADLAMDNETGVVEELDFRGVKKSSKKSKKQKLAELKAAAASSGAISSEVNAKLEKDNGDKEVEVGKKNKSKKIEKEDEKLQVKESVPNLEKKSVPNLEKKSVPNLEKESDANLKKESDANLEKEYAALRSEIEIPYQQFQRVVDLVGRMRAAFQARDMKVTVDFFRHQYLGILNLTSNPLLLYVGKSNYLPLNLDIEKILASISIKPLPSKSQEKGVEAGRLYGDERGGLSFVIVTASHYYAEVLTCRWAQYLLKFDPRAKSLLTLLHFWARENKVNLAEDGIPMRKQFNAIPDPAALEWLCIFYLCKNQIIPTPLEVLNHPSNKRKFVPPRGDQLCIPFVPYKTNIVEDWTAPGVPKWGSKAYVLNVLCMARGFFQFFTSSNFRGSVLKTNDAKIITTRAAFVNGLMKKTRFEGEKPKAQKDQQVLIAKWEKKMFLMQPFTPGGRFSICQERFERVVQPLMRMTAKKLDFYLENQQYQGVIEVGLQSIFRPGDLETGNEPSQVLVDLGLELKVDEVELKADRHQDMRDIQCNCEWRGSACDENELRCHITAVCEEMLMSEEDEKKITMVEKRLNELFGLLKIKDCQMILFRNRYLNFENFGAENRVYFFLDHPGLCGELYGKYVMFRVGAKERQEVITRIERKGGSYKELHKFRELLLAPLDCTVAAIGKKEQLLTFHEPKLGLDFCIAPRFYFLEVQTNRLVEYLCTFDRRVKPVMAVILYWAKKNGIQLGKDGPVEAGFAPDPALLQWLVLYFLHTKGIVPSPNEVCRFHKDEQLLFDGPNIGFRVDPQYAQKWSDHYETRSKRKMVFDVYALAHQFFDFWSKFGEIATTKPLVVDLKGFRRFFKAKVDEVEDKNDFEALSKATKVPPFHLRLINSEPVIREGFYSHSEAVTVLHPLHVKYGFSLCSEAFVKSVCPKMGVTAELLSKKLKNDLRSRGKKGKKVKQVFDVESLFLI